MDAFIKGFGYFFTGFSWLRKKPLLPFILVPLAINIVVFSVAIWAGISWFDQLMDSILPAATGDGLWASLINGIRWVLWPFFASLVLLVVYYTFSLVANIIASPFNGLLSEKAELLRSGKTVGDSASIKDITVEALRSILVEFRKLLYFFLLFIPIVFIGFIPVVQIVSPVLAAIYSAWVFAVTYNDYPLSNNKIYFKDQLKALRANRMLALGFGFAVLIMTLIPVINFFAMPAAVIGATLLWHDLLQHRLPESVKPKTTEAPL